MVVFFDIEKAYDTMERFTNQNQEHGYLCEDVQVDKDFLYWEDKFKG